MKFIVHVPLFRRLPKAELPRLAAALDMRVFENGEIVVKEGDMGDEFFVIKVGRAEVSTYTYIYFFR